VVVDVETTGVYSHDRVIEVAAVTLSATGEIVDEWDTLVNPERDVGPTHIHGITGSMVSAAPRFVEVVPALTRRLDGEILVAHNLPFDSRMLSSEYGRAGSYLSVGRGICTLSMSRQRLEVACSNHRFEIGNHHRALADARATAKLLCAIGFDSSCCEPARADWTSNLGVPRTLRRELVDDSACGMPYLARLAFSAYHQECDSAALTYLDLLDWTLGDGCISESEQAQLLALACELGMTSDRIMAAHRQYLDELLAAALRDGIVTSVERQMLCRVASCLGLDSDVVGEVIGACDQPAADFRIESGMGVCFTGQATYPDGTELPREVLCCLAETMGLIVEESVTKKRCQVLVANDPCSQSGKAKKARQLGIPVVSVADFVATASN
jgi:DNA polymerase-3 subunit epsilon